MYIFWYVSLSSLSFGGLWSVCVINIEKFLAIVTSNVFLLSSPSFSSWYFNYACVVTPFETLPQFFDSLFCSLHSAFSLLFNVRCFCELTDLFPSCVQSLMSPAEPFSISFSVCDFYHFLLFLEFPSLLILLICSDMLLLFPLEPLKFGSWLLKFRLIILYLCLIRMLPLSLQTVFARLLACLVISCWKSGTRKRQKERWQVGCREKSRVKLTRSCLTFAAASGIHFLQCPYFPLLFWNFPKKLLLNWNLYLGAPAP